MDWTVWLTIALIILVSIALSRFEVQRRISKKHREAATAEERQYLTKIDQDIEKGKAASRGVMPW
ncbi:MAG: hypothetical protein Q4A71_08465 [Actinomycetaceae bacterium]|nr:hypothetical protein [Actinomycetaceae bacterium]